MYTFLISFNFSPNDVKNCQVKNNKKHKKYISFVCYCFLFASSQNINTKSLITFDLQMRFKHGKKHIEELKILYK